MSAYEAGGIAAKVADCGTAIQEVDEANPVLIHAPAHVHIADGVEASVEDTLETMISVGNTREVRIVGEVEVAVQFGIHFDVASLGELSKPTDVQFVVQLVEAVHDFAEVITNGTAIDTMVVAIRILMGRTNGLYRVVCVGTPLDWSAVAQQFALQINLLAGAEWHGVFVLAYCLPIDDFASPLVDDISNLATDNIFGSKFFVNVLKGQLVATEVIAVHAAFPALTEQAATAGINTIHHADVDAVLHDGGTVVAQPTRDASGLFFPIGIA